MISKILGIVLCLVAVQGSNGRILARNTCNLQVIQLIESITIAATQSRVEISLAIADIKTNIALAYIDVNLQLNELNDKVNQATGPNVEECKKQVEAAVAQLEQNQLDLCYQNDDLNKLYNQADGINKLKDNANQICRTCGTQADECVSSKVNEILQEINDLQGSISEGVGEVQIKSSECVRNARENASNIINNASTNFDACIKST